MALSKYIEGLRPAGLHYWIVTGYAYDKQTGKTTIAFAGYESQTVRQAIFPVADERFSMEVDGAVTGLSQCYELAKGEGQKLENAENS